MLIHDLGEIYAGDINPNSGINTEEKYFLERDAILRILANLSEADFFLDLWGEYQKQETPEAKIVRDVDRLEMAIQASIYENFGFSDLTDFYQTSR